MNALLFGGVRRHHDFLYEAGYDVSWFIARDAQLPEDLSSPPRRLIAYAPDDPLELLVDLAKLLHAQFGFERVFAFHDDSQELAIRIAAALGLGFSVSIDALRNTRDKAATRRALAQAKVPSCWHASAVDAAALLRVLGYCILPKVVIKPVAGTGSRNVIAFEGPASVSRAQIDAQVSDYPVLVEAFLEGKEYSVETCSANGRHYVLGITEKFVESGSFVECGHLFPARLDATATAAITDYVARVLDAAGVDNTPTHTEIMLGADGPQLIETHTRVGGDWIPTLVHETTGIDLYELGARLQIGDAAAFVEQQCATPVYNGVCGIRYLMPGAYGGRVVKEVHGVDEARALPGVMEVYLVRKPGERIKQSRDSFSRLAYVRAKAATREELVDTLDAAIGSLRYEFE
ncbi:ATP-grasp domain-containing protein [Paraburkholderia tropica]|uniref:ATP-grasp domain-containing protein n=1 Tax=Paraburkholderia tropica TaxID=92647 RepID=UPI0032B33AC5